MVEGPEPGDSVSREVAALKAELVRWVIYQVHDRGREPGDDALTEQIAAKISEAVDDALQQRLGDPDGPVAALRGRAERAEQNWEGLANQCASLLGEIAGTVGNLQKKIDLVEARLVHLAGEGGTKPWTPPPPPPPPAGAGDDDEVSWYWRWVRALIPTTIFGIVVRVVVLILIGLAILSAVQIWPFATDTASDESATLSLSERQDLAISLRAVQDGLEPVQALIAQASINPDTPLATARYEPGVREALAGSLETSSAALSGLREAIRGPKVIQFIRVSGAAPKFNEFSAAYRDHAATIGRANAAMNAPPDIAAESPRDRNPNARRRGRSPTAEQVDNAARRLSESVAALATALPGINP